MNERGKPECECIGIPEQGTVTPRFYVTHVIYSIPGASSQVTYGTGNTFGSTTSTTSSWKKEISTTVGSGIGSPIFAGSGWTITDGQTWGTTVTTATDVAVSTMHSRMLSGQGNEVNHGDDEIWFLIAPQLNVTAYPNRTCTGAEEVVWSFVRNQDLTPYYAYVRDLLNPEGMPPNVRQDLASRGITDLDFPELLKAHPFVNVPARTIQPPSNASIDRNRFDLVARYPYMPPNEEGQMAGSITDMINRSVVNSSTTVSETSYSSSVTLAGSVNFMGWIKDSLSNQEKLTWTHSTSSKQSAGTTSGETIKVSQPTFGYAGPTILSVYHDKIWKTYVFVLDSQ